MTGLVYRTPQPRPPTPLVLRTRKPTTAVEWLPQQSPVGVWIGPTLQHVADAHLQMRGVFVALLFVLQIVLLVGAHGWWDWLEDGRRPWFLWAFAATWILAMVGRAVGPHHVDPMSRARREGLPARIRQPLHFVVSRSDARRFSHSIWAAIALWGVVSVLTLGLAAPFAPVVACIWLVLSGFEAKRRLVTIRLTPKKDLRLAAPLPEGRWSVPERAPSPLTVDGVDYWDPGGGFPRAVSVLATTKSGRRALRDVEFLRERSRRPTRS